MKLTLTFDNGPDPEVTPRVLDVLARHRAAAHFFVLGKHIERPEGRAVVKRAVAEGHLLGNHSYSHEVPLGDDPRPDAVEREIAATQALLEPLAPGPRRFRPFGGGGALGPHLLSPRAVEHLCANRYSCVLWSSVPGDWRDPMGWPETARRQLSGQAHGVIVLHDVPGACLDALDGFLTEVRARGDELVLELPATCVPIVDGHPVANLGAWTREAKGGAA